MSKQWQEEVCGQWRFRTRQLANGEYMTLAKRGEFQTNSSVLEPGELWFEFGVSAEEALHKIKAEIFS